MELKKINDYIYEIPKSGNMKVPVRIFASKKIVDMMKKDKALEQGINVACLPGIYKASLMMADAHQGYGFPIGGVAAIDYDKGCISPGGIGFDINCGVRLLITPYKKNDIVDKIEQITNSIYNNIPVGVGGESKIRLSDEDLNSVLKNGVYWAVENGYGFEEDILKCEENGKMKTADPVAVSPRAKARGRKQLGTLGAGNHFLEIQVASKIFDENIAKTFGISPDQVLVMIHCGSRGLGHQVCADYIRKMEDSDPELMKSLPEKDLIYAKSGTKMFDDYLKAMSATANFAWTNRHIIAHQIRMAFKEVLGTEPKDIKLVYDVAHNIAKIEEHDIDGEIKKVIIHRKGATRAFPKGHSEVPKVYQNTGQPVIIPGSMGTSSYVLVGTEKAMEDTFGSTAHGAGRVMSRHQASKTFKADDVKLELSKKHIYLKARSMKGISEEAPGVYKNVDDVVEVSDKTGIGKLVVELKPLSVIKG